MLRIEQNQGQERHAKSLTRIGGMATIHYKMGHLVFGAATFPIKDKKKPMPEWYTDTSKIEQKAG